MINIHILGLSDFKNTRMLIQNLEKTAELLDLKINIRVITEVDQMLDYDIHGIPAMIIDGKIVTEMVIPTVSFLVNWFKSNYVTLENS